MGAGATSMARSLPEVVDRDMAEQLVAQTPGLKWDDHKWKEVAKMEDGKARRDDIVALLDQLKVSEISPGNEAQDDDGLGALPVYDGGDEEECFAKDGTSLEESFGPDCPGTFSVDAEEGDELPGLEFADGTGGLGVVGHNLGSPPKAAKAASPRSGQKRSISVVEEVIAADGTPFDKMTADAPGTFDEDEEIQVPADAAEGHEEKRPHLELGVTGHAVQNPP